MSAPNKKNPGKRGNAPGDGSKPSQTQPTHHNSSVAQCTRLLARLREAPITTCEARRVLDVYDPPSRVLQLRKRGHEIVTVWDRAQTEAGVMHRVGRYTLIKEAV